MQSDVQVNSTIGSDSYFGGKYWLSLWSYLYGLAVAGLLLATGFSARLRDRIERLTRFRSLRTFLYIAAYILLTAVLTFPLTLYDNYFRERQYGLLTQTFGPWMQEQLLGLALAAGLGGLALTGLLTTYLFLMTPVVNTIIRTNEAEADIFGLNAAREPDGFAEVALLLSEYRKLAPGPWEERLMFDHPSGKNRILMAMRWKAEQMRQHRGIRTGSPARE